MTKAQNQKQPDTYDRLMQAGAELFSANGYEGTSVREICSKAKASPNLIHYHFGNKAGLRDALLDRFSVAAFKTPMKIMEKTPRSVDEFEAVMRLLFDVSLDSFIEHRHIYAFVSREKILAPACIEYAEALIDFLERAKTEGLVRSQIDGEMLTGFMFNRIGSQVTNADWIQSAVGVNIIDDHKYRAQWIDANLDLFLHGVSSVSKA